MLQNRVDPAGNIIRTRARGAWMGNRGVIHNVQREIIRSFKLHAWITCKLEFKGRHREVMTPNRWTELFFLDEATSFAAGHRPCFECRREDAIRFKSCWLKGNPEYHFNEKTSIREIDKILHRERMDRQGSKIMFDTPIAGLPDGSFILFEHKPCLVMGGSIFLWSPSGYEKGISLPEGPTSPVLTPKSVVNTFRAGYRPHISGNSLCR